MPVQSKKRHLSDAIEAERVRGRLCRAEFSEARECLEKRAGRAMAMAPRAIRYPVLALRMTRAIGRHRHDRSHWRPVLIALAAGIALSGPRGRSLVRKAAPLISRI